jgi:hypothetical protein
MSEKTYREAIARLTELADVTADRDQRVYEAWLAHVSKAEIARITGLSWATVDRIVRDMQAQRGPEAGS